MENTDFRASWDWVMDSPTMRAYQEMGKRRAGGYPAKMWRPPGIDAHEPDPAAGHSNYAIQIPRPMWCPMLRISDSISRVRRAQVVAVRRTRVVAVRRARKAAGRVGNN